jgi:superfamily II DNA or RNA helicase
MITPQIVLRPYQEQGKANIRTAFLQGASSVCYQLATGAGKTVIFVAPVKDVVACGKRVLILAHRTEILEQTVEKLKDFDIPYGIIAAGFAENPSAPVQVASVFTLVRRLDNLDQFDFLISDECHHIIAVTWLAIINALPGALHLGVTATPERLDGKGLDDIYDTLICGPSVTELIAQGYLSPFVAFIPAQGPDLRGVRTQMGDYEIGGLSRAMSKPTSRSEEFCGRRQARRR